MTYDPHSYGLVKLDGASKQERREPKSQQAEDILFAQDPNFAPDPDLPPVNQFGGSEPEATGNLGALLQGLPELEVTGTAAAPQAAPKQTPPRRRPAPQAAAAQPAAAAGSDPRRPDRFGQRPPSAAPRPLRRQRSPLLLAPALACAGLGAGAWFWYGLQSLPFAILAAATGLVAGMLSWAMLRR